MIASEKVFFDTAPFIYLVEDHPEYFSGVEKFFSTAEENHWALVTSVLSIAEFGVKPQKENKIEVIAAFHQLLTDFHFQVYDINAEIAQQAYQLRAKYNFLKGMDALQLATALVSGCNRFFTNDKKLNKVEELQPVMVEDVRV